MKKIHYLIILIFIALPFFVNAITIPWQKTEVGTTFPLYTTDTIVVGASATSTTGNIFEAVGDSLFRGALTAYDVITAPNYSATSTTATSTIAGGLAIETSGFVYDYSSNNVGIGTASPSSALHLNGGTGDITTGIVFGDGDTGFYEQADDALRLDVVSSGARYNWNSTGFSTVGGGVMPVNNSLYPSFAFTADLNTGVDWGGSSDTMDFVTGGVDRVRIDSSGNVGIGTATPSYKLDVAGDIRATGLIDASHFVATSTSATSTFAGGFAIDTSGFIYDYSSNNIGIGTTSPSNNLEVAGTSYFSATSTFEGSIGIRDNFGTSGAFGKSLLSIEGTAGNVIELNVNNAVTPLASTFPVAIISDNKNGISGVTMGNANTGIFADFRFSLVDTTDHYLAFAQPGVNYSGNLFEQARSSADYIFNNGGTSRDIIIGTLNENSLIFGTNGNQRMRVASDGNVGIGTTSPNSLLDLGEKNDGTDSYLQIDSESGTPPAGDCTDGDANEAGRMIVDHTNDRLYVCNSLSSGRGWDYIGLTD